MVWSTMSNALDESMKEMKSSVSLSFASAMASIITRSHMDGEHFSVNPYYDGS